MLTKNSHISSSDRQIIETGIENGVFQVWMYQKDNRYLLGRKYSDFLIYMEKNPDAKVIEMDTVYNNVSNGPFLQTFKSRQFSSYSY
ncbi:MAG: hypothetical protein SPI63_09660 [Bulleidia sp.]|nr:hypothetical protein [Bulleidia sp.]